MKSKDQLTPSEILINGNPLEVKGKKVRLSDHDIKPNDVVKKKRKEMDLNG